MRMDNGSGGWRERFVHSFLDWLVLSSLRRRPSYGYEMIQAINEEFHVFVSPGTIYPILHDFERIGLVQGRWTDPTRRSKKIYELTAQGAIVYRDGLDSIGRLLAASERSAEQSRLIRPG
jgi:DNA-binding PadR family transcriptional regulator